MKEGLLRRVRPIIEYAIPLTFILLGFLFVDNVFLSLFFILGILDLGYHTHLSKRLNYLENISSDLDQKLIQSQKLAAMGELSSAIAHEINNPLAIISQELEWMKYILLNKHEIMSKDKEELIDSISEGISQVNRCKEVTHKLLSLARKTDLIFQKTDINQVIEDIAPLVEKEARQRGIAFLRVLHRNLPEIMTDPPLLKQVLLNLLNNALNALNQMGKDGRIVLKTELKKNRVVISVEDNGPGIPEDMLPKIFEPFFTTKAPGKGTGLGLSISLNIVQKLGGNIEVQSTPNKSTVFKVSLPIDRGEGDDKTKAKDIDSRR